MAARSIEAGKAFLKLLVDNSDLDKGLDDSLRKVESFGRSTAKLGATIGAAGLAITAPFAASLKIFTDLGSELTDMSGRTGIAVSTLSELKFAAEQSGASLQTIVTAARNMQKNGLDPATFGDVAKRIAEIEDPAARATAAFDTFGARAGQALLPVIGQLSDLTKKARESGIVIDEKTARAADKLGDAFGLLKAQGVAVAVAIGAALAPTVMELTQSISTALPYLIDFVKEHQTLIVVIAVAGVALLGIGTALTAIGAAAFYARTGVLALRTALTLLSRHPYAIVFTLVAVAVAFMAEKFLLAADSADTAGDAVKRSADAMRSAIDPTKLLAEATEELAEAQEKSIFQQALARMESEKNADVVQKEVDRIKALNKELENRYFWMKQRGIGPGARIGRPETDPNFQNPFGNIEQEDRLRGIVESVLGFFKKPDAVGAVRGPDMDKVRRIADDLRSQFDSISRGFRGGTGGALAEQIAGSTRADAREERTLRLTEKIEKHMALVAQLLRNKGVLLAAAK